MTPSWYDVLDVDSDATSAQIRTAWKAAISDLDPGERRFRLANQAAEVLLDPERRAAHDAALAAEAEAEADDEPAAEPAEQKKAERESAGDAESREDEEPRETEAEPERRPRRPVSTPVLAVLGVLALALVVATVLAVFTRDERAGGQRATSVQSELEPARSAAENAAKPVLSYDYRTLPEDQAEAHRYLTDEYRDEYDQLFAAAIEPNAASTQAVVDVQVIRSAIVRNNGSSVDVLLFVNRPTSNKQREIVYYDQVTMRMVEEGDRWLVDCMITSGSGTCDRDD